jgi:hypothetical protein
MADSEIIVSLHLVISFHFYGDILPQICPPTPYLPWPPWVVWHKRIISIGAVSPKEAKTSMGGVIAYYQQFHQKKYCVV